MASAFQDMINQAFSTATLVPNLSDVQHEPLYDSITINAGGSIDDQSTMFFTTVGPASGKSLGLTNLTQSQKLVSPEVFSIQTIQVRWQENALLLDVRNMLNHFALELWLNNVKPYNRGPLWYYAAGGGIWSASTNTNESTYVNGVPDRNAVRPRAITLVIENNSTFFAHFVGAPLLATAANLGGQGVFLQCLLDGLHGRAVG